MEGDPFFNQPSLPFPQNFNQMVRIVQVQVVGFFFDMLRPSKI